MTSPIARGGTVRGATTHGAASRRTRRGAEPALAAAVAAALAGASAAHAGPITWDIVVNNSYIAPTPLVEGETALFNSYSGSSLNNNALVTFRGRTQGGQHTDRVSGVFSRDMSVPGSAVQAVAVRGQEVPQPNNLDATFNEFPYFPRIDARSNLIATRGQTKPVWEYVTGTDPDTGEDIKTKVGVGSRMIGCCTIDEVC